MIVACQAARSLALGGAAKSAILDTLVLNSYIMLERIGRSREHGETTQGKFGLSRLNIVPKSAFYFRKRLLANGLIVKQVNYISFHLLLINYYLYHSCLYY